MRTRTSSFALLSLAVLALAVPSAALKPPPEATVSARKDSVEITLRLYKKKIKAKKSLWYQLELKNVGKEKLLVTDRIFRDPWAMFENCKTLRGIYLEVQPVSFPDDPHPEPNAIAPYHNDYLRMYGAYEVHYDYLENAEEGKRVDQELRDQEAKWEKEGVSKMEWAKRKTSFLGNVHADHMRAEDRAKEFYLAPGASTTTFAWSYRCLEADVCPSAEEIKSKGLGKSAKVFRLQWDVEDRPIGDYAQLWSYYLFEPGKYKIRAVYPHGLDEARRRSRRQDGWTVDSWEVDVKTPFIEFEVAP